MTLEYGEKLEVIKRRRSVRSYENTPLTPEHDDLLKSLVDRMDSTQGPFKAEQRLEHIVLNAYERDRLKIGSYGFITGQQGFLIGICQREPRPLMDLAHAMEQIVLDLTVEGIGTCWMATTFKRSAFSERIKLKEGEAIAAVIAYGYPKERPSLYDRVTSRIVRSRTRLPWTSLFFKNDFSSSLTIGEAPDIDLCLESVRLAPSGLNKQPWRVLVFDRGIHLYIERCAAYASKRHGFDMQYLDIGIAMAHLEAICGDMGSWSFNDPGISTPNQEYEYIATLNIER